MEQDALRRFVVKNTVYTLLVLACYVLQETPYMLAFFGVRPILVISSIVGIAMNEGEFIGGVFGLFGGILCDTAAFHIFGVASILFLTMGCACGLFIIYLMQNNLRSCLLLSLMFASVYGLICHYFIYGMWSYEGSTVLLFTRTLPTVVFTSLWSVPIWQLTKSISARFSTDSGHGLR